MKEEMFQQLQNVEAAIKTLRYAMNAINCMDNDEITIRIIACNIADSIECIIEYYASILNDIEKDGIEKSEENNQKEKEERLIWVYRHMNDDAKNKLNHYCDKFQSNERKQ